MKLKAISCVDFMATSLGSTEEEYEEIESSLKQLFPEADFEFKRDVFPYQLNEHEYNIYVFDFGGLLPGADDMVRGHYRELVRKVRGNEDKLFILWSAFTEEWYKEVCRSEFPEFTTFNVVYRQDVAIRKRCRTFFGLDEK